MARIGMLENVEITETNRALARAAVLRYVTDGSHNIVLEALGLEVVEQK